MEKILHFSIQKNNFNLKFEEITHPSSGLILVSGESGSGKTNFLRALAGLETQYSSFNWSLNYSTVGFHFQDIKIFHNLSVLENLTLVNDNVTQAKSYLKKMNLDDKVHSLASSLSGGEMQRVGFLRAFMNDAKLIFLDEPFGQVNLELRNLMYEFINEYKKNEALIFVSTHITDELKHDYEIKIS